MEWPSEVVVQMILFIGTVIVHTSGSLEAVHVVSSQALLVCHRSKAKNFLKSFPSPRNQVETCK